LQNDKDVRVRAWTVEEVWAQKMWLAPWKMKISKETATASRRKADCKYKTDLLMTSTKDKSSATIKLRGNLW
jgi:hypothetical protein